MVFGRFRARPRSQSDGQRNARQGDQRRSSQAAGIRNQSGSSTSNMHVQSCTPSQASSHQRKRKQSLDGQDVKETLADMCYVVFGTVDLLQRQSNDHELPDFSRIARADEATRERIASVIDLYKRELDGLRRRESFKHKFSDSLRDNKALLASCDFVWRPRTFHDPKDIEETSLISCSTTFGTITQKVYLHAVLYLQSNGPILAALQTRNSRGRDGLPGDQKCEHVMIRQCGEEDPQSIDGLPCLYISGRPVPQGLTINLRSFKASYDEYYSPADGEWGKTSKALLLKYIEGLAASSYHLQKENHGVRDDDIDDAKNIIADDVGCLESYFLTCGNKEPGKRIDSVAYAGSDATVEAETMAAAQKLANDSSSKETEMHEKPISDTLQPQQADSNQRHGSGDVKCQPFNLNSFSTPSLVEDQPSLSHFYDGSRDPHASTYVKTAPEKTGITDAFEATAKLKGVGKPRTTIHQSISLTPECHTGDSEEIVKPTLLDDVEDAGDPPAKRARLI